MNIDKREKTLDKKLQEQGRELKDQGKRLEDSFSMIQKMSNKVVALERKQAQGGKSPQLQYQAPSAGRPPNQWNNSFD